MANLQEQSVWETGIYQLETSDPVLAGPDGVDNLQGKQLANRTAYLKDRVEELASGKQPAGNAVKLSAARNITMSGDGSWNVAFDGSKDVSGQLTLRDSGVAPGSYGMVTVDAKGRVTAARQMSGDDVPAHDWNKVATGKPSTLAGYGIADGASKTDLQNAVNGLVSGAPANLNTLQELAAAVNNDPKYSATVDGKLAGKADKATTLAGYGITDAQPASPDLAALANLKGAAGLYVNTGPGSVTVRTLVAGQGITVSNGDGKTSNPTVALANSGAAAGTYGIVTVDAMGRVTAGRAMTASDVPALDWSKIATGKPTTLAGYGISDGASKQDLQNLSSTTTDWQTQAESLFANIKRKSITVGGAPDHWYPVVIDLPIRQVGDIHIARHVHFDREKYGEFNGYMYLHLKGMSGEWGGMPPILYPAEYSYGRGIFDKTPPVANFSLVAAANAPVNSQAVIWLLGSRTYEITTSCPTKIAIYSGETSNLVFADGRPEYNIYLDAMISISNAMIANGYIRGA
ncbi:hypothetical protein [Chromobacterium violaceum]|uniref:hypothetical protein n=1 Tax=Chromobacterium violaceum TaxID=536 RepID=UPI0005B8BA09|nr:hypothetical protein [Chromobacterium violaceum]